MAPDVSTITVPDDAAGARQATDALRAGGLVAFPTETVYGLGADAANGAAVAALYRAKGRPSFNPLIAHLADLAAAQRLAHFNPDAMLLAEAFWPGPLTLVLPKSDGCDVSELATAGLDSVALRVPRHDFAQQLLRAFGGAVVAPSANRSGHVSPTTAAHVAGDLEGRIDLIVDGGPVVVGVESTIISCLGAPTLLRPGGLARQAIEAILGRALALSECSNDDIAPRAPGMLASHYAPRTRLRLDATSVAPDEALLAFGVPLAGAKLTLNLSPSRNVDEAAAKLFGYLRALDGAGARTIAAMPVPEEGLGEAINDRLRRAAAPRH
jgi:L-threonylcarbamoyladenylate synthase